MEVFGGAAETLIGTADGGPNLYGFLLGDT